MNPITTAWRWSVRYSPIMGVFRLLSERVRRHRAAAAIIEASGLPDPICARISAIVRRTRLHVSEQREVARELIAHAQDATDAGKHESEILSDLGDPPPVARLIRRAVKRRRPLAYQIRRWSTRAALVMLALTMAAYVVLLVRFQAGAPNIETDYYARINAPVLALPESEKAWPVYRDALVEWTQIRERLAASSRIDPHDPDAQYTYPGVDHLYDVPRDHPDYGETVSAFLAFRPTLDQVAQAALRPTIGVPYSDRTRRIPIEGTDRWIEEPVAPSASPEQQSTLFMALLPQLGSSRTIARLLAFDIQLALEESDADRVSRDLHALLGLATQLKRQPTLISSLVAIAVQNLALTRTALVLDHDPDLLSTEQLRDLSHALAASRTTTLELNLETERYAFDDLLQRSFTDDGQGGGRLSPEGFRLISESIYAPSDFGASPGDQTPWLVRSASSLVMPVVGAAVADRARQSQLYDEIMDAARQTLDAGPAALQTQFTHAQERLARLERQDRLWFPLSSTVPAIGSAVQQVFLGRAATDQTLALLAAAVHRLEHGAWPESLDQLIPTSLPSIPSDPFDDTHLKYRLDPDGPRFWYAGADQDDDAGQAPTRQGRGRFSAVRSLSRRANPDADAPDGDWVLFPPQN